jgi:hypothetical protein
MICKSRWQRGAAFAILIAVDPETRNLLNRILDLTEENNRYLRKLYRAHWWGTAWKTFYWVLIIGATFGAYYVVQPYLDEFGLAYGTIKAQMESLRSVGETLKDVTTQNLPNIKLPGTN